MRTIYHEWIKDNPDVIGKEPAYIRPLADDIDLELYTGKRGDDPNGWITAVIAVIGDDYIYRFKYDGGGMEEDGLSGMADDCEFYIKEMWDLDEWRKEAKDESKN